MRTDGLAEASGSRTAKSEVSLLTGGSDRPYAIGLAIALVARGVCLDFIGSDELESPELRAQPRLNFLNLRGNQRENASLPRKVSRTLSYYARLIGYISVPGPRVLHILWNNKFELFDRTLLMLYYKLRGKKIVLTVHNVNAGRRDANDSLLNRLTLRIQYLLSNHIFVHTEAMKKELREEFGVGETTISVIPFGINNSVPNTDLTRDQAKRRLGIQPHERTILFFGHVGPYKGLEFLVAAFHLVVSRYPDYRLIIAGKPARGSEQYLASIQRAIGRNIGQARIIHRFEHIPDAETELYFKGADVLVLPYTQVSQSGVLVLGYSFGLPVIAADVGSLREDIVEGQTGFLSKPRDPVDLAESIERYFRSDLFEALDARRQEIRDYASQRYSWDAASQRICTVYRHLGLTQ